MAYLALYRAFRPETLTGVVRQEHIVKILCNQIANDRIGHAYLFCGPRGTGKTSIAKIFARAVNCEHPLNGSPCGACPTCKALNNGNNLDVVEIDAASNNGVDEMRDLREKVQYPPVNGRFKVYIVDEVHMLSPGAFNALLKTLEEPPKHAVFILATTEAQKIPATILSRCMRFDFKLIPQEDLENHLKKILDKLEKPYEEEAVAAIARAGAGSVRDMLSIADICISYESGKLTYAGVNAVLGSADFFLTADLCAASLSGDMPTALSLTEKVLAEGKGIGVLVRDILQFLNHCSIAKMCRNAEQILCLPTEMYQKIKAVADGANGHRLLRVSEIFAETESKLRYSTSARIILETAVMKASMPETDYNLDGLLARISALEEVIKSGGGCFTSTPAQENNPVLTVTAEKQPQKLQNEVALPVEDFPPLPEEPVFDGEYAFFNLPAEKASGAVEKSSAIGEKAPIKREEKLTPTEKLNPASSFSSQETSVGQKTTPMPTQFAPTATPMPTQFTPTATPMPAQSIGDTVALDKRKAFGMFLRSLRKTSRNGVLFTMCSELESVFEGDTMVMLTTSETIYKSLNRPEHFAAVTQALQAIGVTAFEIRIKQKKSEGFSEQIDSLKKNFSDTPIVIK